MLASKYRRKTTRGPESFRDFFLRSFKLLRQLRITEFGRVKVNQKNFATVFHLAFAQIVQMSVPARIRRKVIRYMFRQQNVTSICAIHDSLCKVDPGAGDVCPLV